MTGAAKLRVLVAKPGLDGHDRGVFVVAQMLRDAGHEVIILGLRQTPEMIASVAIQEDVDVVGLSILSGAHLTICRKLVAELRERGAIGLPVVLGGVIPDEDLAELEQIGVRYVLGPGATRQQVLAAVENAAASAARD